jgi:hypothetical protein
MFFFYLPSQQEQESFESPSSTINIITIENKDSIFRRITSISKKEKEIMQLSMNITNNNNRCSGGRRRIRIMTKRLYRNAIRFLVKHLGSDENE